jgi:hypothetical protein
VKAFLCIVLLGVAGGIAYASIPDSGTGTYHACVQKSTGAIRVIDPETQHCNANSETEITFDQTGPSGISPTVTPLAAGDSHCAAGGAAITDAAGTIAYVCSGQAFSGTFTSPNGQYTLSVADSGVTITGPSHAIVTLTGAGVTVRGDVVNVKADTTATIESGGAVSLKGQSTASIESSGSASLQASDTTTIKGSHVAVNGGSSCAPSARLGDQTHGVAPPGGGDVAGQITTGSTTVCVG